MPERKISRRDVLRLVGGGIVLSAFPASACAAGTVIVRLAPTLLKVGDVLLRLADGILIVQGILKMGSEVFDKQIPSADAASLSRGATLIIEDGSGKQFISAFGVYDDVGIVQTCDPSGTLTLRSQPAASGKVIRSLSPQERLGIFDLRHSGGWYHVKTLGGEAGWVHGNCLKPLPRKSS